MPVVPTADLVARARRRGAAVAAFNIVTLEHAEGIVAGAEAAGSAVVLQISHNAVRFHHGRLRPIAAAAQAVARDAAVDVALHLDHAEDLDLIAAARDAGLSSVMFDAAALPHPENVARTRVAAERAHAAGLWVEAELGYVGGKPDAPRSAHEPGTLTDPDEARAYVAATGVDALAVAVGSTHAMATRTAVLDLDRVAALRGALAVPLVLHGSSGVPDATLADAVRAGITKVNVGTALNLAFTRAVRAGLAADPRLHDPRPYLADGRDAVGGVVEHLCRVLASAEPVSP